MTSNKELGKEASNAGMQLVCKGASCSARQVIMESIAGLVDKAAASNGGRVPRGYVSKVIKQFLHLAPGLTRHQIFHCRRGDHSNSKRSATTMSSNSSASARENLTAVADDDAMSNENKRQKGGRQNGTTIMSSHTELQRYKKACAEAAQEYSNARQNVAKGCRLKKGTLNQIIDDVKKKHSLEQLDISKYTIKNRVSRGSLAPSHRGTVSPMERVEPM